MKRIDENNLQYSGQDSEYLPKRVVAVDTPSSETEGEWSFIFSDCRCRDGLYCVHWTYREIYMIRDQNSSVLY